jgi:competence ComEA-like helix-hairpin-helix protein
VAEHPDAKAAGDAAAPAVKPARPWVMRAEAIATLALAVAFLVWVGVIIFRQRQAGRDLHWIRGQGAGVVCLIDINRAGVPELMLLPGVGPSKAERIVKWRQEHGAFHALEELQKAAGITARELAGMRSLVTLGEPSREPPPDADYAEPEFQQEVIY